MGDEEHVIPQPGSPFCWASCLGDCSPDFSREHIITKSTIPGPQIFVEGFPFQRGAVITLHKNQFSSNILCRYHNNKLSSVDQAGTNAFDAFRDAASDTPRRKNKIRGDVFERWLLKTFINIELLANFDTRIPPELIEIAFGRKPFVQSSGSVEQVRLMHHPARFNFASGNILTIDWRKHVTTKVTSSRRKTPRP
jgi:hypothetical protein